MHKLIIALSMLSMTGAMASLASAVSDTSPPPGYRGWYHVKSAVIGPSHAKFADMGGFQHIYANREAMAGYNGGTFPEGSVIVFEWLRLDEKAGRFTEGALRQQDVMIKDEAVYAATGGWGFRRFPADAAARVPSPQQCFACHAKLGGDELVLSKQRK